MEELKSMKNLCSIIATIFVVFAPASVWALPVECYCVLAIRTLQGVEVRGDAYTLKPNVPLSDVREGDVLLMKFGKVSHAAYVSAVETLGSAMEDGSYYTRPVSIYIWQANKVSCKITTEIININDRSIIGVLRV